MKTRREWTGQGGIALLEVLVASIILGIAAIGVSLMLSRAQSSVVGQGDRYVALYLAQQKIEKLTAIAITNPPAGFDGVPTGNGAGAVGGCPANEACYNETNLQAGEAALQGGAAVQTFTRATCVNLVTDDDPTTPATCTDCTVAANGATCTNNTKRITVTVTPSFQEADPVTLVTVITRHPANN